jgi:hypothetical protein
MKTLLTVLLFAIFPSLAFAQNQPTETAAAPGCGAANTKFEVKTNSSQHPFAKPEPGKALVYFLQDDTDYSSISRPTTRFGLEANWIGATRSNSYFYISVNPGEHHLCASWQSLVGFTDGHRSAALRFTAAAGNTYFFLVRDHIVPQAGMEFLPLDSDEAQLLMSGFAFSTSRPKT